MKELSLLRPGRKLLKRLLDSGLKITDITKTDKNGAHFDPKTNTIFITTEVSHYVGSQDMILCERPFEITLAHEMIHAMQHKEEKPQKIHSYADVINYNYKIIDPRFDNKDEQVTICGVNELSDIVKKQISLCENVFLKAYGLPLRVSHRGLEDASESTSVESHRLYSLLLCEACGDVERIMKENPKLLNDPVGIPDVEEIADASKKLLPLTVAAGLGNMKMVDTLLRLGARVDLCDDIGGPIAAAFKDNNTDRSDDTIYSSEDKTMRGLSNLARHS